MLSALPWPGNPGVSLQRSDAGSVPHWLAVIAVHAMLQTYVPRPPALPGANTNSNGAARNNLGSRLNTGQN
jgi:hypothetical protein